MRAVPLSALSLCLLAAGCRSTPETPLGDDAAYEDRSAEVTVTRLVEDGGRVDWSWANGLIAFDRQAEDGFFDVWTMTPDGEDVRCLTCDVPGLPTRNVGQPAWHPSGEWLVVQAEDAQSGATAFAANPGRGVQNDLWLVRADGSEAHLVHDVPAEGGRGVLHPHIASDGRTVTWSEMREGADALRKQQIFGYWSLASAELVLDDGAPHLVGVTYLEPGGDGFYENHGVDDEGAWIFSANLDPDKGLSALNDLYVLEADGALTRLTTHGYNEHGLFAPDETRVLFMSNAGNPDRGTDWWLIDRDGGGLTRLTRLDRTEDGAVSVAADATWGPDGRSFVGYVQHGVGSGTGEIVRVTLP